MKITIDILDEEYMPECPLCHKPVNINKEVELDRDEWLRSHAGCDNCGYLFEIELIVRQAKAIE